jgi:hypothetical protein
LVALAANLTFPSYFLDRDVDETRERQHHAVANAPPI